MTTGTEPSEVDRLKSELDHEHQMYLRALADFDNYRRRVERDQASATRRSKRDILLSVVELLDSFDRALEQLADAPPSVANGMQAIHRQLLSMIEAQGVTPFETIGERFDPELHEAIGSDQAEKHDPGTVTEEVRRGYRWGDELLRPARVRVAQ